MKNTNFIVIALFTSLFTSAAVAAEFKVGVVDMQKAIQTSTAGKKAKKEVEGDFEKKKKDLKKKEDDLKKRVEEFEKKQAVLSDKVRQEQQVDLQKDMMQFREEVSKSQVTIQQRERELTKPILEKLQKVILEIAKEKDFSIVLEKAEQSVMFAKTELDITDEVIKRADK
jgi:outer membrane protein